jgi:hypothetical protein
MTRDFAFAATVSDVPVSLAATNALTLSEADFGKAFNGMVHDSAFMQRYDQQRQVDPAANAPELSKDSHFEANNAYEKAMAASYDASVKLQALGYTQQGKINVPPAEVQVAAQKLSAMGELGGAAVNPQQTTQLAQTINGLKPETAISSLQASPNSGIDSGKLAELQKEFPNLTAGQFAASSDAMYQAMLSRQAAAPPQATADEGAPQPQREPGVGAAMVGAIASGGAGAGLGGLGAAALAAGGGEYGYGSSSARMPSGGEPHRTGGRFNGFSPGAVAQDISGSEADRARELYDYATTKCGLDHDHACAMLGNGIVESGLKVHSSGGDVSLGGNNGIFEWLKEGRWKDVEAAAQAAGRDPFDPKFEIEHAVKEMRAIQADLAKKDPGHVSWFDNHDRNTLTHQWNYEFEVSADSRCDPHSRDWATAKVEEAVAAGPAVAGANSGVTPVSARLPNPGGAPVQNFDLAFGDSIAGQLAEKTGIGGVRGIDFQDGISPSLIARRTQATLEADPDHFKGKHVLLASGSNDPSQLRYVGYTVQMMKKAGAASVTVLGVGDRPDIVQANAELPEIVQKAGGVFAGPLGKTVDHVHPKFHKEEKEKALAALNKAQNTQVAPNAPSGEGVGGWLKSWLPGHHSFDKSALVDKAPKPSDNKAASYHPSSPAAASTPAAMPS